MIEATYPTKQQQFEAELRTILLALDSAVRAQQSAIRTDILIRAMAAARKAGLVAGVTAQSGHLWGVIMLPTGQVAYPLVQVDVPIVYSDRRDQRISLLEYIAQG